MSWLLLLLAGLFEVAWAIGLKYTDGFSRPLPTLLTLIAMGVSVLLLAMAVKQLPLAPPTRYGPASARSAPC